MTEFVKIDLDKYEKPALVRLKDEAGQEETDVTEARFTETGVRLTRFGSDKKPKSYYFSKTEMDLLSKAWTDYQVEIHVHEAQKQADFEYAVIEAKELAESVKFDLESLNIKIEESTTYDGWNVLVPALAYKRYIDSCDVTKHLVTLVQNTLDYIRIEVEQTERWERKNREWNAIIASYRRVFPLEQCQLCQKSFDLRDMKKLGTGCEMLVVCDPCGQIELKRRDAGQGEPEEDKQATEQKVNDWYRKNIPGWDNIQAPESSAALPE